MKRIHVSRKPIDYLYNTTHLLKNAIKPVGLWYSFENEWLNFCKLADCPGYAPLYQKEVFTYELNISNCNILKLQTAKDIEKFADLYLIDVYPNFPNEVIDWKSLAEYYDGIEFSSPDGHYIAYDELWYSNYSVVSGCVWDTSAVIFNQDNNI